MLLCSRASARQLRSGGGREPGIDDALARRAPLLQLSALLLKLGAIAGAPLGPAQSVCFGRHCAVLLPRYLAAVSSRWLPCYRSSTRLPDRGFLPTMAAAARMRLTVVVEALAEENAHGEYRDMALAAFKERKFAMPVQLDDTFETVWADIEQRYKTNYLNPQQAATFGIKKLQDAYECDLDMTDTVGAIFEGEPDRKMHLIKVIPHFVYRETSVVPGSMLRPAGAQKRAGGGGDDDDDDDDAGANKRRRIESQQRQGTHNARHLSPNRPLPSTELQQQQQQQQPATLVDATLRPTRSSSGVSLVELSRNETGQPPFSSTSVKQEPPDPEQLPALRDAFPIDNNELPEAEGQAGEEAYTAIPEPADSDHPDPQEPAIHESPISSAEPTPAPASAPASAPAPATKSRRDVYRVPSSPDFMHKKATPEKAAKTYGRSPRSGANLLNMARRLGRTTKEIDATQPNPFTSTQANKAHAFQRTQLEDIESTPHQENGSTLAKKNNATINGDDNEDGDDEDDLTASFLDEATGTTPNSTQTSARKTTTEPNKPGTEPNKPGNLKKPSRASLVTTPASMKRAVKSKAAAMPASRIASRPNANGKTATPSIRTPKGRKESGGGTMSRMERLEKLLNSSGNSTKHQWDMTSPAWSDSARSQNRSQKSSPEVRIPVSKKLPSVKSTTTSVHAQPVVQSPKAQATQPRSPLLPPSSKSKKSTRAPIAISRSILAQEEPGKPDNFKKPAAHALGSTAPSVTMGQLTTSTSAGTPRRSEIPLPPNVRHLRRSSSSLQASPLLGSDAATNRNSPSAVPAKESSNLSKTTPQMSSTSAGENVTEPAALLHGSSSIRKPVIDNVVTSNVESSSTDLSGHQGQHQSPKGDMDRAVNETNMSPDSQIIQPNAKATMKNDDDAAISKTLDLPNDVLGQAQTESVLVTPSQIQLQPPSGQCSKQAMFEGADSWSFESLNHLSHASDMHRQDDHNQATTTAVAHASEEAGFADQDIYSTAVEDNASRSRSGSANSSSRSSPAVSRRPARFLSHSPTPDASESECDSDDASQAPSRGASPQAHNKDVSQSESESSSDSSEDDDFETSESQSKSNNATSIKAAPPSSPPLTAIASSTPMVPETTQSTPSQHNHLIHRTPIPLPTQQSSQAPRSSQSVSVQAADRRRYTGFRSLREQLADTKAAQATSQKKIFDPRTMSLGKLVKGKPLSGFGADDDDSSDDESDSSSSDDSE